MLFYGNLFKVFRESKGLTLEQVGKSLGVSKQTVGKWENGKTTPRPRNILAIAKLFGISVIDISDLKPEKDLIEELRIKEIAEHFHPESEAFKTSSLFSDCPDPDKLDDEMIKIYLRLPKNKKLREKILWDAKTSALDYYQKMKDSGNQE